MKNSTRFVSLDAFRGLAIALMILVNTPGSWAHVYAPLRHAAWHGCTPADLVFPFFLFIIGVSLACSLWRYDYRLSPETVGKVLRRALIIFALGLILNAYPFNRGYSTLRIMGVLQRIALAYGVAAFLVLCFGVRKIWLASGLMLAGYWALLLTARGDPFGLETNLVRRIDLRLLGANHLWTGAGVPFDPEGLLSTLPAVVTVLGGYLAGRHILAGADPGGNSRRLLQWGVLLVLLGLLWGRVFPINKSLWTGSYVLLTSGLALLLLAAFIRLVEVRRLERWSFPLVVFGRNALFVFVLSSLWIKTLIYLIRFRNPDGEAVSGYSWLYHHLFAPALGLDLGSIAFALAHLAAYWALLLLLYRRQVFIKI